MQKLIGQDLFFGRKEKKLKSYLIENLLPLVKGRCSIKAAGGIKSLIEVLELINSGCSAIGTSKGPELMKEFINKHKNIFNLSIDYYNCCFCF